MKFPLNFKVVHCSERMFAINLKKTELCREDGLNNMLQSYERNWLEVNRVINIWQCMIYLSVVNLTTRSRKPRIYRVK